MIDSPPVQPPEFAIDITGEVCPMTFVKTKLALEKLPPGGILRVRLNSGEPLKNVPRSAEEHGYRVLSLEPEDQAQDDGVHLLIIRNDRP